MGVLGIISGPPLLYVLSFKFSWIDIIDLQSVDFQVNSVERYLKSFSFFYDTNIPTRYLFYAVLYSYPCLPLSCFVGRG